MLRYSGSRVNASCPLILVGFMTLYACGDSSKKSGDTPPVLITTCQSNQILSTDGKTCVNVGNVVTGLTQADCDKIDQILSADGKSCEFKPVLRPGQVLTQADCDKTNQVLSADGKSCLNKPILQPGKVLTQADCDKTEQVLSADGKSCVNKTGVQPDPILTQADCDKNNQVLSSDGKSCVNKSVVQPDPILTQVDCDKTNQVLSSDGKSCVNKPVIQPGLPPNIVGVWTYCTPFFEKWSGGRLEFFADGTYTDVWSFGYTTNACSPKNMAPGNSEISTEYKYKITEKKVFPAKVSGADYLDGAYEFDTNMKIGSQLGNTKYLALHIDGKGELSISYVSSLLLAEDGKSAATRAKTFFDVGGEQYKKK